MPGIPFKLEAGSRTSGFSSWSSPKKFCCSQCVGENGAESETLMMSKNENSLADPDCTGSQE